MAAVVTKKLPLLKPAKRSVGSGIVPMAPKYLALLIPDFDRGFINRLIIGAEKSAKANDCILLVVSTRESEQQEIEIVKQSIARGVDGFILMPTTAKSSVVGLIQETQLPLVIVERLVEQPVHQVGIDHFKSVYKAIEYLINSGHRRLGYIGWRSLNPEMTNREAAFRKAAADYQIPTTNLSVKLVTNKNEFDAMRFAKEIIEQGQPTAIFAAQTHVARGLVKAIHELKIRIPDELSLIIYGEQDWAEYHLPSLSCIRLPDFQLGEKAVELIVRQIKGFAPLPQPIMLYGQLLVRNSVIKIS